MELTRKQKGDLGEVKAIEWLLINGYVIFKPLFENGHTDLIAEKDDRLYRVTVKYTSSPAQKGRKYRVALKNVSRRNNGIVATSYFDSSRFDLLLAYIAPEDRVVAVWTEGLTNTTEMLVY